MSKKLIGSVTEQEKNEIQTLFERRNGLNELAIDSRKRCLVRKTRERYGRYWYKIPKLVGYYVAEISMGKQS